MGVDEVYLENRGIDPDGGMVDMTEEEFYELMDDKWLNHPDGIRACIAAYESR